MNMRTELSRVIKQVKHLWGKVKILEGLTSASALMQQALEGKANLEGGNEFAGNQTIDGDLLVNGVIKTPNVIDFAYFNTQEPSSPNEGDRYIARLVEEATNLWKWSEANSASKWNYRSIADIIENVGVAPDGTISAELWKPTVDVGLHRFGTNTPAGIFPVLETITMSVFVKDEGYHNLIWGGYDTTEHATFDLATGTVVSSGNNVTDSGIIDEGNGWFRIWSTFIFQNYIGNGYLYGGLVALDASLSKAFAGNGGGYGIWGVQIQTGSVTPYISTNGTAVTSVLTANGSVTTSQVFDKDSIYTYSGGAWQVAPPYPAQSVYVEELGVPYSYLSAGGWQESNPWKSVEGSNDLIFDKGKIGLGKVPEFLFDVGGVLNVQPVGSTAFLRTFVAGNVVQFQSSVNDVLFTCLSSGGYSFRPHSSSARGLTVGKGRSGVGFINDLPEAKWHILNDNPSFPASITQAASGQSANVAEWKDSLGNVLMALTASGNLKLESLNLTNLPTSATGLATGDVWNDGGSLKIV